MTDSRSHEAHARRLRQVRKMRESEAAIAREAIEDGLTQGDVAYLLGRSREWLRRHIDD